MRYSLIFRQVSLAALGVLFAGACLDVGPPEDFTPIDSATAPTASDPLTGVSVIAGQVVAAGSSAPQASESEVTYVSLPPGTVPGGIVATITNTRLNVTVTTAVEEGGFDPVALPATAGDSVLINVQLSGGLTTTLGLVVPRSARPRVVRTDPPPKKRDVPLNSRIVVVFSEPLLAGSEAGIVLRRGGARVPGSVALEPDGLRAEITPSGVLAPNSEYEIVIPTTVRDQSGEALEAAVRSTFTTGTTRIAASVATDPTALIKDGFGRLRTYTMRAIRHDDGRVFGNFSTFSDEFAHAFGRVECFTIVNDAAWVAGIVEGGFVGTGGGGSAIGWVLGDNPPASGVPDGISLGYTLTVLPDAAPGAAQGFCANTPDPTNYGLLVLYPLVGGNIVVNESGPPPPLTRDLSKIAFASPDGGIQVIDADGTNGRVLTGGEGDFSPAWSPDGTKIAFNRIYDGPFGSTRDIYVINADGSGLKQLTPDASNDSDPAWSPNGSEIAYGRDGAIYVMNADGSGVRALTSRGTDSHPTWSPDGSRIAFASSRNGTNAIYVMASDGTGIRQITSDTMEDRHPMWSPDGQQIAFERVDAGVGAIHLVRPDGTGLTKLTLSGSTPSWSPESRVIAFVQDGLTLVNADGSGMLLLGSGYDPAWSPRGDMPPRPEPFVSLTIAGGDGQSGPAGTQLSQPLSVRATRADGSPVSGVRIWWYLPNNLLPGQPSLSVVDLNTDVNGLASVTLTLGASAPAEVKVRAAIIDGTGLTAGVEFTAYTIP